MTAAVTYPRGDDLMVEYAPHRAVAYPAGRRLGLVAPLATAAPEPPPKRRRRVHAPPLPDRRAPTEDEIRAIRILKNLGCEAWEIADSVALPVETIREQLAWMP
jgi:hypothetical protein